MIYRADHLVYTQQANTVIAASSSQAITLGNAAFVRIACDTKGIWYKFGDTSVSATAGGAAEGYVPAGRVLDIPVPVLAGSTAAPVKIAIIQDGATAVGSVTLFS